MRIDIIENNNKTKYTEDLLYIYINTMYSQKILSKKKID